MPEGAERPAVFTIPAHRSFADALAAGLIQRFGRDPLGLATGRILLPNSRAVRTVTEAFVRASGSGLLLPRLIPIGDPELDERIGGALEPLDDDVEPIAPAVEPLQRLLILSDLIRSDGMSSTEALRLAQDLARTLDALLVEQVDPQRLTDAAADAGELAAHWQVSLDRLRAIVELWPKRLAEIGRIDLAERRNRLLERLDRRRFQRQMERASPNRTAPDRRQGSRIRRCGRRGAGHRAGAPPGARNAGQDGGAGYARPNAGEAGLGAASALGHRGRRQRRPAAVRIAGRDIAARNRGCRGGRARPGAAAGIAQASARRWGGRRTAALAGC